MINWNDMVMYEERRKDYMREAARERLVQQAKAGHAESLALLENHDRYEAGRTRLYWGIALLANEDPARSRTLLQEARLTFASLGAIRDLEMVDRFLHPQ